MITTKNIGKLHQHFNHDMGEFTQVLVMINDMIVAQFYGLQAKILAADYVVYLKQKTGEIK